MYLFIVQLSFGHIIGHREFRRTIYEKDIQKDNNIFLNHYDFSENNIIVHRKNVTVDIISSIANLGPPDITSH